MRAPVRGWLPLTLVVLLGATACARGSFFEFRRDEGCWDWDPSPPKGVDLSVCTWPTDSEVYAIDPDGDCWRMPTCGFQGVWEGWRSADLVNDAWCFEASQDAPSLPECD